MTRFNESRIRRLTTRLLTGGLLASLGLCAVFYLLTLTIHPPAPLQPGSTLSIKDWIDAYANWHNAYLSYTEAMGLSLVAALAFVVAFGIFIAPRMAFAVSFSLLNVFFLWTSHLLYDISAPLDIALGQAIASQAKFLWITGSLGYFFPSFIVIADLEPLALLGILTLLTLLLSRGKGAKRAVLLSLQVAALCLIILGTQIAIFDHNEFYLHVTQAQSMLSFVPSFTNADLLFSALAIFAVSTCLLNFRRLRPQRY